jgi:hypothetical protein
VTWRFPRFTTLQLLLAAAFCALALGLATASWRSSVVTQVTAVGFSPGGKYLAARYASGFILVWDVSTPRPRRVASLASSSPWVYDNLALQFADGQTLVDVSRHSTGTQITGEVRTLDVATGKLQRRFAYKGAAEGLLFAASGDTVALVDWPAGIVDCYSLREGRLINRLNAGVPPWCLVLTPDGRTLIVPDANGSISMCDVASGNVINQEPAQGVMSAAISSDGGRLAFVGWQNVPPTLTVHVRELESTVPSTVIDNDVVAAAWVAFADAGSKVAIASYEAAEVHDLQTGRRVGRVVFDREVSQPEWWPWTPRLRSATGFSHFSISADGRTLATFDGSRVLLWDLERGKLKTTIGDHSLALRVVLFTALFAAWSAAWGIVSRRQWQRAIASDARPPLPIPIEVKLCWGLLLIGGLVSLGLPIAIFLSVGPMVWPMFYVALFTGIAEVSRGAARDPRGLPHIAALQLLNIAACDPVNFLLGTLARTLLNRPHVRQFLHQAANPAR